VNNEFDNDRVNDAWIAKARILLDESAAGLDAPTLSRLNRARQAALAGGRPRAVRSWFLPTGLAGVCVLLLAVAAWVSYTPPGAAGLPVLPLTASASSNSSDIDLVSGDDSLELYQDLEFYAWLDAQDQGSDG